MQEIAQKHKLEEYKISKLVKVAFPVWWITIFWLCHHILFLPDIIVCGINTSLQGISAFTEEDCRF